MPHTLAEIEQQARDLPAKERARLALALIQSLKPADEGDVEEAWRIEVEVIRRFVELYNRLGRDKSAPTANSRRVSGMNCVIPKPG